MTTHMSRDMLQSMQDLLDGYRRLETENAELNDQLERAVAAGEEAVANAERLERALHEIQDRHRRLRSAVLNALDREGRQDGSQAPPVPPPPPPAPQGPTAAPGPIPPAPAPPERPDELVPLVTEVSAPPVVQSWRRSRRPVA